MKSLYRTVYDLRKDVRDLKKSVEEGEEGRSVIMSENIFEKVSSNIRNLRKAG